MTLKSLGPRLTAIGSGKGGTGKTFVAVALAQAFADLGERVLLCDADLGLANTAVQLGLASGGDLPGLLAGRIVLATRSRMSKSVRTQASIFCPRPPAAGALADADGETAERLAALLKRAPGYDRVLIDLGAGVGAAAMTLAAYADDTLVLATPDPASLTDAYAFAKLMLEAHRRTGARDRRQHGGGSRRSQTHRRRAHSFGANFPEDRRRPISVLCPATCAWSKPSAARPCCARSIRRALPSTAIAALAGALGGQTGSPQTAAVASLTIRIQRDTLALLELAARQNWCMMC